MKKHLKSLWIGGPVTPGSVLAMILLIAFAYVVVIAPAWAVLQALKGWSV